MHALGDERGRGPPRRIGPRHRLRRGRAGPDDRTTRGGGQHGVGRCARGAACSSRPATHDGRCGSRTRSWPTRSTRSSAPGSAVGSTAAPCRCCGASTRTPRPDTVVELARHSALAGDLTAAQRWAMAAADHASEHLAPSEAAAWCERALSYADERQVPGSRAGRAHAPAGRSPAASGRPTYVTHAPRRCRAGRSAAGAARRARPGRPRQRPRLHGGRDGRRGAARRARGGHRRRRPSRHDDLRRGSSPAAPRSWSPPLTRTCGSRRRRRPSS